MKLNIRAYVRELEPESDIDKMLIEKKTGNNVKSKKVSEIKFKITVDVLRIFGGPEDAITALNFGPFDNGYILAGMKSGRLLILDPITLKRMHDFPVFPKESTND